MINKKIKTDSIAIIFSVIYLFLMNFIFMPCGIKEDGTFMNCHYAYRMILVCIVSILILSIIKFFIKNKYVGIGIIISTIIILIISIIIPNNIIPLCMIKTMRCHSIMVPANNIFAIIFIILSVVEIYIYKKP
mgnify:CR=1 FL=1